MIFSKIALVGGILALSTGVSNASTIVLIQEDFESLPDQSGAAAIVSSSGSGFGTNQPLGFSSNPLYTSAGAAISFRNGLRSYTTPPDAAWTTNTSNRVGQLVTHTGGGWGLISVPLASGTTNPAPISLGLPRPLQVGDKIQMSFDLLIQTPSNTTTAFLWNTDSASGTQNTTWNDYTSASGGDIVSVFQELVITSATTDITTIAPQFRLVQGNNTATTVPGYSANNISLLQIDNFVLAVQIPEPSRVVGLLLFGLALTARRRR